MGFLHSDGGEIRKEISRLIFNPMSKAITLMGFGLCSLIAGLPGFAADSPASAPAFGNREQPIDLSGPVTLQSCIGLALGQNFTVRIQHFTVEEAVDSVAIQKAAFEPIFGFTANKQVTQQATNQIAFSFPYSAFQTAAVSVSNTLTTGGTLSLNYNLVQSDYSPAITQPNPSYGGAVSISVAQPLLQGAGTDYNRAAIESARLGVRISNLNFKSTVLTMVYNVETTYYNLLYQREQYKVQQEQLKQARQLLDDNTNRRQAGTNTDVDVVNARAGVAAALNLLILDKQTVQNSEDSLLQLLGDRRFATAIGEIEFPSVGEPDVSFDLSYKLARDNGPNLAVAQATIDQYKLAALKARRNTLPELNLNGGLGYNSFAATAGQSVTGNWNGYNWNAGLTLSIPWGMRANRALYYQALSQQRSQEVAYDQADQNLMVSVRSAVRAVATNIESVRASAENTKYAAKAYELTMAQFNAGLATSFLVLQSQNTLETARLSELQAKVNLLSAVANLHFLEGSSLQLYRINLPE
jgi:outer membrane protein